MPSSFVDSVPGVMHLVIEYAPGTIVDVGPGWGKYGLMCREYLPRLRKLDAVEVPQGRLEIQEAIYDDILEMDARKVSPSFWQGYHVALLIDMIEHMTLEEGHELLYTIQRAGCSPIVSTPKVFVEQHDDTNPYETHVSVWGWEDFAEHGVAADQSTIDSVIYRLRKLK